MLIYLGIALIVGILISALALARAGNWRRWRATRVHIEIEFVDGKEGPLTVTRILPSAVAGILWKKVLRGTESSNETGASYRIKV